MRVLAAMSGGVDSAVAAARALDAGHDVTGVHLALARTPAGPGVRARGCCTAQDALDARRAADLLGIPFYVWDLSERFQADVIDDFLAEYAAGRTPNPCLRCNEQIKFAAVLERALALGFDAVATGHYAQLIDGALHRAVDAGKDQSYVLGVLTREQLAGALFPLGGSLKSEVRAEAAARGLAVADKPDSTDTCFIPDGDTAGFLSRRLGAVPGHIVERDGAVVGSHDGAYAFTVGQRRGLRLGRPAPDGKPRYVLDVVPSTGTVTVGPREALAVAALTARAPRWAVEPPADGSPVTCGAQLRAHGPAIGATATLRGDEVHVSLAEPAYAVAPGQAAVLYDGNRVLGSATIATTVPAGIGAPVPAPARAAELA